MSTPDGSMTIGWKLQNKKNKEIRAKLNRTYRMNRPSESNKMRAYNKLKKLLFDAKKYDLPVWEATVYEQKEDQWFAGYYWTEICWIHWSLDSQREILRMTMKYVEAYNEKCFIICPWFDRCEEWMQQKKLPQDAGWVILQQFKPRAKICAYTMVQQLSKYKQMYVWFFDFSPNNKKKKAVTFSSQADVFVYDASYPPHDEYQICGPPIPIDPINEDID